MNPLQLHGKEVTTIFDLLGRTENDMTYSLGWCLAQVPAFLDGFGDLLGTRDLSRDARIRLQEFDSPTGITDIEIHSPGRAAWVVEAKQGYTVPSTEQLKQYASRLNALKDHTADKGLAILAQSDRKEQWLPLQIPDNVDGIPVRALSWGQVKRAAEQASALASNVDKRLLREFVKYLGTVVNMKNETSNRVYVVSLGRKTFGGKTTFVEVVEKYKKYFHPIGGGPGGWPSEPPNYLAFRYDGALQSIHHVEDYEVITNVGDYFREQPSEEMEPHFLYSLGPPIRPNKKIPTGGRWRANRVWCFIDTLLTCETIAAAREETDDRLAKMRS